MRHGVWGGMSGRRSGKALAAMLLVSSSIVSMAAFSAGVASAQALTEKTFSIPSGSLSQALTLFGRQAGLQVTYNPAIATGKQTAGVRGSLTANEALARLLAGSGLNFSFPNASTIAVSEGLGGATLAAGGVVADGSTLLNTITVSGKTGRDPFGSGYDSDAPYNTAGSVDYKTEEQIQRFRGTSAGDLFKGIPGVMTGEARNSGAVDVNIRGMQGQGRVPVVVDGATQETTVYHGYNGSTARTYIDPDFIGSMSIEKGPSAGADATGATGGMVRMSTINPSDILLPGKNIGVRLKGSFNTNSSSVPELGTFGGHVPGTATFAPDGMDRPGLLAPTAGSGSAVFAATTDYVDFVAGHSRRRNGNYHAGSTGGDGAHLEAMVNQWGTVTMQNAGLSPYRAGEEVLNTSQDITSALIKGRLKLENGHQLELGYSKYKSEYGHVLATQVQGRGYQGELSTIDLDTLTARYRWQPDDNNLIDFKVDSFATMIDNRINSAQYFYGTMYPFYVWVGSERFGTTLSNTSRFDTDWGDLKLTYGGGITHENVGLPDDVDEAWYKTNGNAARQGYRKEFNGFVSSEFKPLDWLTLEANLRYQHFNTLDQGVTDSFGAPLPDHERSDGGLSPMASITIAPIDGLQLYGKYANTMRLPSIFEALQSASFLLPVNENPIDPEQARTLEAGINYMMDDVLFAGDKLRLHAAYFDNHIDGYITRSMVRRVMSDGRILYNLGRLNLDYADMRGFEVAAEYDTGQYFGGIFWNHYTSTMFCAPEGMVDPAYSRCGAGGIYNSFALQMVPPKDMVTVNLGARLLDEKLTLGGRFTYVGKRMVEGIGDGTNIGTVSGRISASTWKPYGIVDLFASYKFNEHATFDLAVDNLTDRYYMDAINVTLLPAPGRTIRGSLTVKF